jgi:hypothetical protein
MVMEEPKKFLIVAIADTPGALHRTHPSERGIMTGLLIGAMGSEEFLHLAPVF